MTDMETTVSDMTIKLSTSDDEDSGAVYGAGVCAGGYISDECGGRYTVDCWGDGDFYGYGCSTNAPTILGTLLGSSYTVNNYGQYRETAEAVAFRQGAIYATVKPFTVGDDINGATVINYEAADGEGLSSLSDDGDYFGDATVYIDGEKFSFRKTYGGDGKIYPMAASQLGKAFTGESYMFAEGCGDNHTALICVGRSGWANSSPETLREIIKSMIRRNGNNNYLVISPPCGSATSQKEIETTLGAAFGKRFFNARKFLSAYGLSENALTATSDDEAAMENGEIPPSLLNDDEYGNEYFHTAFAKGIFKIGKLLGLWN